MKKSSVFVTLCVCFFAAVNSQVIINSPCQNVTIEQNFDLPRYLGRWYEYRRFFTFFELNGKCVTATYSDNLNGTIEVRNYQVDSNTNVSDVIVGYASQNSNTDEGKLIVTFPTSGSEGDYWILDTDYDTFSVVWSCSTSGDQSVQFSWILTREIEPSAATLAVIDSVVAANGLASEKYLVVDQTNCPLDP
ncbi:apolipoprotein D-like [Neocloeon triangulifer]|uniref:apolipoprotein D-like n=1 Tax=Neocloeon triangulifer TaxID=2078957 RepID=UPI00286F2C03|nr:apolipoprotein D-like [Neocloeon triangulifer]